MTQTAPSAEILSQGDEVVTGQTVDTNAAWIAERLTTLGFTVLRHTAVGDRLEDIRDALRRAAESASLCVCTGGLGPTEDDLTAAAVAAAFDRPLALDPVALDQVAGFYRRMERPMPEVNRKQALLPRGAVRLDNDWGTAPGFAVDQGRSWLAFVPGVPREMRQMIPLRVEPLLLERFNLRPGRLVTLRTVGIGESNLQERIGPFRHPQVVLSYRTMHPENQIKLRFPGEMGEAEVRTLTDEMARRIGSPVFAVEGLEAPGGSLVEVVAGMLRERGQRVALAEVSSGGHLAAWCSAIEDWPQWLARAVVLGPGASADDLGVPAELLAAQGPASAATAEAMARAARDRDATDYGLATSAVAQRQPDASGRMVGDVFVALATARRNHHRKVRVTGDQGRMRRVGASVVLDLLRRELAGLLDDAKS